MIQVIRVCSVLTVHRWLCLQPISLGMNRSDYMFHSPTYTTGAVDVQSIQLKQIEFNTMASSFGGLSQQISELHRYVIGHRS